MSLLKTSKKITVLQVATLNRPIKRELGYGPIETVIYNIDQGLHEMGHRSIVACSGDSEVTGEKFTTVEKSFSEYWSEKSSAKEENTRRHLVTALQRAKRGDIDIIHMHDSRMMEYIFKGVVESPVPVVMTLHVPANEKGSFKRWNDTLISSSAAYFVPISEFQNEQHYGLINGRKVIHHGIDVEDYPFQDLPSKEDYLFSIGRITADKGQDIAIEVAKRSGKKLIIAGNVQNKGKDRAFFERISQSIDLIADAGTLLTSDPLTDTRYYREVMKPLLAGDEQIIYIGEVNSAQKKMWFQYAQATLFPIQWGEPFGLVLVESMACGTPVLAFNKGSVPEIVRHGKTGFVVNSTEAMVNAVESIPLINRSACRRHIKDNFSITSMAGKYSELYEQILGERTLCLKTSL